MAEQLLDHAQVGAALEQVRGERVAELVRVRREPAQRARVEPAAAGGEEDGVLGALRQLRPAVAEVERRAGSGLLAERDGALLAALAADVEELLLEVDVLEVEADRLGAPQAGRVDELDERAVAQAERPLAARARRAARRPPRASARTAAAAAASARAPRPERATGPSAERSSDRTAESLRPIEAGASFGRRRPRSAA